MVLDDNVNVQYVCSVHAH